MSECMTQENINKKWNGNEENKTVNLETENRFFENKIAHEHLVSLVEVKWMTTSEAAQYLRVSADSIKTMVYRGKIRVHKLGRRNRFLREELDRLIVVPIKNRRQ